MKDIRQTLSFIPKLFIVLAVSLLLAEIFLRVVPVTNLTETGFFWMPDKKFGWRHIPEISGYYIRKEFKTYCTFNSEGWRDYERDYDSKQNNTFRIIALGDSFVESVQVPLEKTFLILLERRFNTRQEDKYEVLNMGCSAYGTFQEYIVLKEYGKRYKPDMVIIFFNSGDLFDNQSSFSRLWERERTLVQPNKDLRELAHEKGFEWDTPLPTLLKNPPQDHAVGTSRLRVEILNRFYLPMFCYKILLKISSRKDSPRQNGEPKKGIPLQWYFNWGSKHSEVWGKAWENTKTLLLKIKEDVQKLNVDLLIVQIPLPMEVYADRWNEARETYPDMKLTSWDLERPYERLARFCEDNEIKMFSLLPEFKNNYEREKIKYHYYYDGHFNEAGHELAAELLFEYLKVNLKL